MGARERERRRVAAARPPQTRVLAPGRDWTPTPAGVLALQRAAGNRAVAGRLQRKRTPPTDTSSADHRRYEAAKGEYAACKRRGDELLLKIVAKRSVSGTPLVPSPPTPDEREKFGTHYSLEFTDNAKKGCLEIASYHQTDIGIYHVNEFYPDGRIVANSNYIEPKKTGSVSLNNNKILWLQYLAARERLKAMPPVPTELARDPIANLETVRLLWMCLDGAETDRTFLPGSEEMSVLLGTQNGRAAAYMVLDHGVAPGIASIDVHYNMPQPQPKTPEELEWEATYYTAKEREEQIAQAERSAGSGSSMRIRFEPPAPSTPTLVPPTVAVLSDPVTTEVKKSSKEEV
jgi:hypothetical protein